MKQDWLQKGEGSYPLAFFGVGKRRFRQFAERPFDRIAEEGEGDVDRGFSSCPLCIALSGGGVQRLRRELYRVWGASFSII